MNASSPPMATKTPPPLASGTNKKRQRTTRRPLEVHVVEDHADVLEHLYDSIGAKRTSFSNLEWVHFDSHPDLTLPPDLSLSTVRDPQALYDVLDDSEGGNAEFILPAVVAGHVTRVTWVRSPWARQLPDGLHRFHVGVEKASACLRVTFPSVYYLDEGLYCDLEDMEAGSVTALELRVCPVEDSETLLPKRSTADGKGGWLLDICLDYYSTENPFLEAVERIAGREAREAVCAYFEAPRFRQEGLGKTPPEVVKQEVRKRVVRMGEIQSFCAKGSLISEYKMATFQRLTNELIDVAAAASSSSETDERRVGEVMKAVLPLLAPGNEADGTLSVVTTFVQLLHQGGAALVESVRRLGGHCSSLPSHQSSWKEMEGMISETVKAVEALCQAHGTPPSIILMARSARDGYTPLSMVDALQEKVLQALFGIEALGPLRIVAHFSDEGDDENEDGEES